MAKPQILQSESFVNSSDAPVEIMIPANERAEVFFDQDRFSFVVKSSPQEPASVVLEPGSRLQLL